MGKEDEEVEDEENKEEEEEEEKEEIRVFCSNAAELYLWIMAIVSSE